MSNPELTEGPTIEPAFTDFVFNEGSVGRHSRRGRHARMSKVESPMLPLGGLDVTEEDVANNPHIAAEAARQATFARRLADVALLAGENVILPAEAPAPERV